MNSGLVIYTGNLASATDFYVNVFDLKIRESDKSYVAMERGNIELVLLETKESSGIGLSSSAKEGNPIKPVFFVNIPILEARERIKIFGGKLNDSSKEWNFNHLIVCDGIDIEGNVFQIRSKEAI